MREREKEDVIMDVCPNCGGMWLDAGELDKLVASEERYYSRSRGRDDRYNDRRDRYDDDDDGGFFGGGGRGGFLGGLFGGGRDD
jgi:Zn-finger nucleic acid-binding protein